jgi:hypothetical protein
MVALSLHSSDNPGIRVAPHHLNWLATNSFYRDAPLIGDDFYRAALGTSLRWDILALFYWLKTNFGRTPKEDVFQIGFGGSPEDTAINSTLHALQNNWQTIDDLPLSAEEKDVFLVLIKKWEATAAALLSRQAGQPLPKPEPKPTEPPKPPVVLVPKPDLPAVPEVPAAPTNWKALAKYGAVILTGVAVAAKLFAPGIVGVVLDIVISVLRSIGAM